MKKLSGVLYLAAPYSDPDKDKRQWRYKMVTAAAAKLISKGHIVFSPITMTHPIDELLAAEGESLGSNYWIAFDLSFMKFCSEMRILQLPGWEQSRGIKRESQIFRQQGKKISYMSVEEVSDTYEIKGAA